MVFDRFHLVKLMNDALMIVPIEDEWREEKYGLTSIACRL
ncbi:MAG: hypothetical protein IJU37_03045 [Desulfovibrio sp.]|nr:hypothetical protein [Desulfovibrio sp.]